MDWEKLRNQSHMRPGEFQKFIEIYQKSMGEIGMTPCNESQELEFRHLATAMWDAGRLWEETHNNYN